MGRIALFVILIAGAVYFGIDRVAIRLFDTTVSPVVAISLSVLMAVVLWTLLMWWGADRFGRTEED